MKKIIVSAIAMMLIAQSFAQNIDLPRLSPVASVMQMIGLTKVEINYSSPAVKGRTIWGGLEPYDKVWRTGANEATTIAFGTDVTIGGQKVKAGKYALFTIPGKEEWTVIINSNPNQWGAYGYKQELDVIRVKVKPEHAEFKERMAFYIDALSDSKGRV